MHCTVKQKEEENNTIRDYRANPKSGKHAPNVTSQTFTIETNNNLALG